MYYEQDNETVIVQDLLSSLDEVDFFVEYCRQCVDGWDSDVYRLYYCVLEPFEYVEGVFLASRRNLDGVLERFVSMVEDERLFYCDGRQVGVALVCVKGYKCSC